MARAPCVLARGDVLLREFRGRSAEQMRRPQREERPFPRHRQTNGGALRAAGARWYVGRLGRGGAQRTGSKGCGASCPPGRGCSTLIRLPAATTLRLPGSRSNEKGAPGRRARRGVGTELGVGLLVGIPSARVRRELRPGPPRAGPSVHQGHREEAVELVLAHVRDHLLPADPVLGALPALRRQHLATAPRPRAVAAPVEERWNKEALERVKTHTEEYLGQTREERASAGLTHKSQPLC